ncbi:hypothetical protein NUW54_g14137 [Trametes sanguinea]|uniref:Uncharacterized protein n=1 Tax=Trametes sanguinea TaxID=158606 RepID=A0ACC1MEE4_9APHY|nr:hypothetical protein NUW54_g14137 [Trametes sanguinea]
MLPPPPTLRQGVTTLLESSMPATAQHSPALKDSGRGASRSSMTSQSPRLRLQSCSRFELQRHDGRARPTAIGSGTHAAVEARLTSRRRAETLTLTQHASLHLRECRSMLEGLIETDPINNGKPAFYPLSLADLDKLDEELALDSATFKNDWFAYNGGALDAESSKSYKKPLFFDIAVNYISLDMDRLQERAGKAPVKVEAAPAAATQQAPEKKAAASKAKVEEVERAATPEPSVQARGGLGSLLGGWWGRK